MIPEWEQETVKGQAKYAGKIPLILEPGLTFGTGSHATTRLCLTALEEAVHGGETVLDLGPCREIRHAADDHGEFAGRRLGKQLEAVL